MDKKRIDVAIAIILDQSRQHVLICQRRHDTVLGGLWEFPGGKCNPGEPLAQCAQREVTEELGIAVECLRALDHIEHDYPHALVRLHPFVCQHISGVPQMLAVQAIQWIVPSEIHAYPCPSANEPLLALVAQGISALL